MSRLNQALEEYNQYLALSVRNGADIEKYSNEWDLLCAIHCCLSDIPLRSDVVKWAAVALDGVLSRSRPDEEIHYIASVLMWGVQGCFPGVRG